MQFKQASKKESRLRMNLQGVSGAGKTYTSLAIASELGQKIAFIDTEHGSASKYADIFNFDVIELSEFPPERFIEAIRAAEAGNYDVVIIDSLSHEWTGKGGILEIHENEAKRTKNSYTAWASVTPRHNALIEAIVQSKCHVIATMRSKTEHVMKQENGKTKIERAGLAAVQREGFEYEFDIVAELDIENNFIVQKSRCSALSGKVFNRAGANVAEILKLWLSGEKQTPTRVLPIQPNTPLPATTGPANEFSKNDKSVSPEIKGKLLFEGGFVSRNNKGYVVTESINGSNLPFQVEKKSGVIVCNCEEFKDGISDRADFQCGHIIAVKNYAVHQQKAA